MSSSPPLKVVLFIGSTRIGRMATRVSEFVKNHLIDKGFEVDVFDPKELKFPVLEQPIHFYPNQADAPDWLKPLNARIAEADAFVVVSGEYNFCIPPALTNMMNHFPLTNYYFKPSLIVSYSVTKYGGLMASTQLRTFLSTLGCTSIANILSVSKVMESLDEAGQPLDDELDKRASQAVDQFKWIAQAYKEKKARDGPPKLHFA